MRFSSRLAALLVGGTLAAFGYYQWADFQIAAWCAERHYDPCRVPADGLVLGTAFFFLAGAVVGVLAEAIAHRVRHRGVPR